METAAQSDEKSLLERGVFFHRFYKKSLDFSQYAATLGPLIGMSLITGQEATPALIPIAAGVAAGVILAKNRHQRVAHAAWDAALTARMEAHYKKKGKPNFAWDGIREKARTLKFLMDEGVGLFHKRYWVLTGGRLLGMTAFGAYMSHLYQEQTIGAATLGVAILTGTVMAGVTLNKGAVAKHVKDTMSTHHRLVDGDPVKTGEVIGINDPTNLKRSINEIAEAYIDRTHPPKRKP